MSANQDKLTLYANCIPVLGQERAIICDIQRQRYHVIPDTMYEVMTLHVGKTVEEIKAYYKNEFDDTIEEYMSFLLNNEYAFFTNHPERFPPLSLDWDHPSVITNCIVDLNHKSPELDYLYLLNELELLGCEHLEIRSYSYRKLQYFVDLLDHLQGRRILSIDFLVVYGDDFDVSALKLLCERYSRIRTITIHSSPEKDVIDISVSGMGYLYYCTNLIDSEVHCGIVHPSLFALNVPSFTEAQNYNTCLNRKVSIDVNGFVKNCPSLSTSYGKFNEVGLSNVVINSDFQEIWNVSKDQIDDCKVCEFRYVCTDCRAYTEDPLNALSRPLKCGYNLRSGEWEEWSDNPIRFMSMKHYLQERMTLD